MIPQYDPQMTGTEAAAIKSVLDSGFVNDGPVTAEFEKQFAAIIGRRYGVAVPNCTSAIALALMACGAKSRDDVIVPDFTMIATANAVRLTDCNVVFADVEMETFCLSAETIKEALTPQSRFVVAVEVNGRKPNYEEINDLCKENDLILITDSCEALGSSDCGRHGVASCFSFAPNKIITTGQGGMVVTDSPDILHRLRQLKYQGLDNPGGAGDAVHHALGFNFKFTDIQAAMGVEQLKVLNQRIEHCRKRSEWYRDGLSNVVELPKKTQDECLWLVDILTDYRASLVRHLREKNIGVRAFWLPLNAQPAYQGKCGLFPNATVISTRGLWLPSSYAITENEVGQVIDAIKEEKHLLAA